MREFCKIGILVTAVIIITMGIVLGYLINQGSIISVNGFILYYQWGIIVLACANIILFFLYEISLSGELKEQKWLLEKAVGNTKKKQEEIEDVKEKLEKAEMISERNIRFSNIIQKHENIKELIAEVINTLAKDVDASQGAFFVLKKNGRPKQKGSSSTEEKVMKFVDGYAYQIDEDETIEFEIGEGLIGQVAMEGKILNLEEVPEGYIQIVSGLGTASPKHLVLIPLNNKKEVVGVIEMASFTAFSEVDMTLFESLSKNLGAKLSVLLKH